MCLPFLLARGGSERGSRLSDLVHVSVRPRGDARRAQFYRTLGDHVHAVAGVVAALADGPLNVPLLRNAAQLVQRIAELGQAVNANKDECDRLVEKTSGYLSVLSDTLSGDGVRVDAAFRGHVVSFVNQLSRIEYLLLNLSSRSYWARLLRNAADRRDIQKCQTDLDNAFAKLHLANIMHTAVQLHGLADGMSEVQKLVSRSTDDLRQQFNELQRAVTNQSSFPEPMREMQPQVLAAYHPRPHPDRRQPRRPNLNLQISNSVERASLYRPLRTSPYHAPLPRAAAACSICATGTTPLRAGRRVCGRGRSGSRREETRGGFKECPGRLLYRERPTQRRKVPDENRTMGTRWDGSTAVGE